MAIRFNPCGGCCQSFPAWTVYHENISDKLHYYLCSTTRLIGQNSTLNSKCCLVYSGIQSGLVVYSNCQAIGDYGGGEIASGSIINVFLEKTNIDVTGINPTHEWIHASKVSRVEISGIFRSFNNSGVPINTILVYDENLPQYTMGNHYCHISGFSGALKVESGTVVSGFSLYPHVGARVSSTSQNQLTSTINVEGSGTFSIQRGVYSHYYNLSGNTDFLNTGGRSSGTNTFDCNLIATCPFHPFPTTYFYSSEHYKTMSGVAVKFTSTAFALDPLLSPRCCITSTDNYNLYNDYYLYNFSPSLPSECQTVGLSHNTFLFSAQAELNGGCEVGMFQNHLPSGILFCNSSCPDYYSNTINATCGGFIPERPILGELQIGKISKLLEIEAEGIIINAFGIGTCPSSGDVLDSWNCVGNFCAAHRVLNVDYYYSYNVFDLMSNKHIVDDFSPSDFINIPVTPIIVSGGFGCPSVYSGTYNYVSGGTSPTFQYIYCSGAAGNVTGTFSVSNQCDVNVVIHNDPISFSITQTYIPDSDACA